MLWLYPRKTVSETSSSAFILRKACDIAIEQRAVSTITDHYYVKLAIDATIICDSTSITTEADVLENTYQRLQWCGT